MEGNYRQKSMYLDFILILLTSWFFRTFTHVLFQDLFSYPCLSYFPLILFLLFMLWSFLWFVILLLTCNFFLISFYIHSDSLLHYYTYLPALDYANHEAHSIRRTQFVQIFAHRHFALMERGVLGLLSVIFIIKKLNFWDGSKMSVHPTQASRSAHDYSFSYILV